MRVKHGALDGRISSLSCSFSWGQLDSSLFMGDPLLRCANNMHYIINALHHVMAIVTNLTAKVIKSILA